MVIYMRITKFNILLTLLAFCVGYLLIYDFIKGCNPIFDNIKIISINILIIFYYILALLVILGIITTIVRIISKRLKKSENNNI
jgi:hypothetical protein